jgi:hypothetical protein
MIRECLKDYWIIVWKLFMNLKNWTWMNFIHKYYMYCSCVLILTVAVIYYEPSIIMILKKSKCCVCHTSSLTNNHHGLKYVNISMNL